LSASRARKSRKKGHKQIATFYVWLHTACEVVTHTDGVKAVQLPFHLGAHELQLKA
jgi:hypothetical protein